jgi:hypothetical protein
MSLQQKTVVLDVTFHMPSNERKGNMELTEVDADKDSLRLSKEFIRSKNYTKIRGMRPKTNQYLDRIALPSPFKSGTYLIPVACLEEVWPKLEAIKAEYTEAADRLAEEWTEVIEDAKRRLRSQFDPRNYPSVEAIRAKIWMTWNLIEFATPDSATLGEALYEQEKEKAKANWAAAEREVIYALRASLSELINHLVDRLRAGSDGSKKKLHASTVEKVTDFLDNFGKRNVMDDSELSGLVDKAKNVLAGKDVEVLRTNTIRQQVGSELQAVSGELSELIQSTKRAIRFSD